MELLLIILFPAFIIFLILFLMFIILKFEQILITFYKKTLFKDNLEIDNKNYSIKVMQYRTFPHQMMTQILIGTQGALPNIYLDSNSKLPSMYSEKHLKVKSFQKHSLEGDMDDYFTVYTPEDMKIESLQFLTPDIMHYFKDNYPDFDIVIYGGTFDMRKAGKVDVKKVKENYEYLLKKVNRIYKYWNTQDKIDSLQNKLVS